MGSISSDLRGLLCLSVWLFAYLHSQCIQTTFHHSFVQIWACFNCSTPSKEKLSCLGEHYYHKILLLLLVVVVPLPPVSHLLPRPTEKNQLLGPPTPIGTIV